MAITGITFYLPVSLVFDDTTIGGDEAERDFFRMLDEAERAGLMERKLITVNYGEPVDHTPFTPHGAIETE